MDYAELYALGSIIIGTVLVAHNLMLIRRKGVPATRRDDAVMGWSFAFMTAELAWAGASLLVLVKGYAPFLLPTLYLVLMAAHFLWGVTGCRVRVHRLWYVKTALACSGVFAIVAIYRFAA